MLLMNIGASEWVIIVLLLIFLVAGSNKLSSLARLLGRATGEYEKAKEMRRITLVLPSQIFQHRPLCQEL